MNRSTTRGLFIVAILIFVAAFCQATDLGGLCFSEKIAFGPAFGANTFADLPACAARPDFLNVTLQPEQRKVFDSIIGETYWSIGFLAANTASILITLLVDPFIGSIVGIVTLCGYAISTGNMAIGYGDLIAVSAASNVKLPDTTVPRFASLGAAAFAMGTITAVGLSYTDDTGTATILAGVCGTISLVSGIVAVISTFAVANDIGPQ
jgi:hypothetical protein